MTTSKRAAYQEAAQYYVALSGRETTSTSKAAAFMDAAELLLVLADEEGAAAPVIPAGLARFAAKVAATRAGTGRTKVAVLGDSIKTGAYFRAPVLNTNNCQLGSTAVLVSALLRAAGYPAAGNNSTFGDQNYSAAGTSNAYDPRLSFNGQWQYQGGGSDQWSLGANWATSINPGQGYSLTPADPFDTIEVFYISIGDSGKHLIVSVDGTTQAGAAISLGESTAIRKATRSCALGTHTVNVSADAPNCILVGINTFNSAALKIEFYNTAIGGSSVGNFARAATAYNLIPSIALLAPDLSIVDLTVNDSNGATASGDYSAALEAIITNCLTSGDVLLVTGTPGNTANMQANSPRIVDLMKAKGAAHNLVVVDTFTDFGTFASAQSAGLFPAGEDIHPSAAGLNRIASKVAAAVSV